MLSNKYYVDELYNATVIDGTFGAGSGLWAVDRTVVDGAVNGAAKVTAIGSWFSGLTDRTVVDGLVNLVGWVVQESSLVVPPFPDRPGPELRVADAARHLRLGCVYWRGKF